MIATSCYKENVDCRYVQCIGLSLQLLQIYNNIKPLSIAYGQKFQYFQVNVCCLSAILVLLNPYKSESLYFFTTFALNIRYYERRRKEIHR